MAVEELNRRAERNPNERYDRLIVITDEESHDSVAKPKGTGYVINVASYKKGSGHGTDAAETRQAASLYMKVLLL
jgi:hypothetical protein